MSGKRILWCGCTCVLVFMLWLVAVQRAVYVTECSMCGSYIERTCWELVGHPIRTCQRVRYEITRSAIAKDLGIPCDHRCSIGCHDGGPYAVTARYWGLFVLQRFTEPHPGAIIARWYDTAAKERLKQYVKENPSLVKTFRRRVLLEWDPDYWELFAREVSGDIDVRYVTKADILTREEMERLVSMLPKIRWIDWPPDPHNVNPDPCAQVILAVGRPIAPLLVEALTDETPSAWLAWGTVGDVAHFLLARMYERDALTEFLRTEAPMAHGQALRYYVNFHKQFFATDDPTVNATNRAKLQSIWRAIVAEGGGIQVPPIPEGLINVRTTPTLETKGRS